MPPTLVRIIGFEHGITPSANGGGLCNLVTGSACSISSSIKRTGSYSLRVNATGTASYISYVTNIQGNTVLVGRAYFYIAAYPDNSDSFVWVDLASQKYVFGVEAASPHRVYCYYSGSGTFHYSTFNISSLNTWYGIDFKINVVNNPQLVDWRIWQDGNTPTAQTQISEPYAATTVYSFNIGTNYNGTVDEYIDDAVLSVTSGDYPIGIGGVEGFLPNEDGTHNAGTNIIEDNTGADIGAVTAYDKVNTVPFGGTATYIRQFATGTGNYAEVNFADTSQTVIHGAQATLAYRASNTTANEGACTVIDEDATVNEVWGNPTTRADYSESSPFYKFKALPNPAGTWDQSAANVLKTRMGYSNNVATYPYWLDILIEVAYGPSTWSGDVIIWSFGKKL